MNKYFLIVGLLLMPTSASAINGLLLPLSTSSLTEDPVVSLETSINGTQCLKSLSKNSPEGSLRVNIQGVTHQIVAKRLRIMATILVQGSEPVNDTRFTVEVGIEPKEIVCEPLGNRDFKHFYIKAIDAYEL